MPSANPDHRRAGAGLGWPGAEIAACIVVASYAARESVLLAAAEPEL